MVFLFVINPLIALKAQNMLAQGKANALRAATLGSG